MYPTPNKITTSSQGTGAKKEKPLAQQSHLFTVKSEGDTATDTHTQRDPALSSLMHTNGTAGLAHSLMHLGRGARSSRNHAIAFSGRPRGINYADRRLPSSPLLLPVPTRSPLSLSGARPVVISTRGDRSPLPPLPTTSPAGAPQQAKS